jgi:glucosamine--fructose-6-phosphate aminotransferase (isomerizing)
MARFWRRRSGALVLAATFIDHCSGSQTGLGELQPLDVPRPRHTGNSHPRVLAYRRPLLQVVLAIVPLQLFAYHLARARALNVDQPRNLAKTVTVA